MIKDTMKRKKPSFDESYYGYRSFTHLLEEADNPALVDIERNPKSGTYVVTRFCGERAPGRQGPSEKEKARTSGRRRARTPRRPDPAPPGAVARPGRRDRPAPPPAAPPRRHRTEPLHVTTRPTPSSHTRQETW